MFARLNSNEVTRMPTPIQGSSPVANSCLKDESPPPTPQVTRSIAFERAADGAAFWANNTNPTRSTTYNRDPVYLEMNNVEVGTKLEFVNLSKNPEGKFTDSAVSLELTGRDVRNRQGAVYLNAEQMAALDLQPGDMLSLRAVDEKGNASAPTAVEIQPNEWRQGVVREDQRTSNGDTPGAQFSMLDGEGVRKNVTAKIVNDSRPPMMLDKNIRFVTWTPELKTLAADLNKEWGALKTATGKEYFSSEELKAQSANTALPETLRANLKKLVENPQLFRDIEAAGGNGNVDNVTGPADFNAVAAQTVALMMPQAMEPGAVVDVQNSRTGSSVQGTVDANGALLVDLKDLKDGDPILLYPRDNNGVQGKATELVYSSRCKDGKAPNLKGGLGVRLGGVI